jgi:hypothetical protein
MDWMTGSATATSAGLGFFALAVICVSSGVRRLLRNVADAVKRYSYEM